MAFFKHLTNITPQGIFLPGQGTCSQMSPQIIGSWCHNYLLQLKLFEVIQFEITF